jgi:hypothetical protein
MRYAVLWWRASGQLPDQIEIQYLTEKWSEHVKEAVMMQMENELRREIDAASVTLASPPAKSCPGDHCGYCDVRQFCDDYWQDTASMHRSRGGFVDVQLAVNGEIAAHGFSATTASGSAVKVTSSSDVGKLQFRGLISGDSLRIIGARFESRNNEYYLSASAEIWRLLPYTPI